MTLEVFLIGLSIAFVAGYLAASSAPKDESILMRHLLHELEWQDVPQTHSMPIMLMVMVIVTVTAYVLLGG